MPRNMKKKNRMRMIGQLKEGMGKLMSRNMVTKDVLAVEVEEEIVVC